MVEGIEKTGGDPLLAPISQPFKDSMAWIKENTPEDSVIISWWDYGDYIQLFGSRYTVAADTCESELCLSTFAGNKEDIFRFDSEEKINDIARFFTTSDEDEAYAIARKYGVDYVMVTYEEFGKSGAMNNIAQGELAISFYDIQSSGNSQQDEQTISDYLSRNGITSYHIVNFGDYYKIWYLSDNGKPEMKEKLLARLLPFNTGNGQGLEHFEIVYSEHGYIWIYKIDSATQSTAPPTTTASPTPPSDMIEISSDTFDSDSNNWPTGEYDNEQGTFKRSMSDGKYRFEAQTSEVSLWHTYYNAVDQITDFYLTVDARGEPTGSGYGVRFRNIDGDNHYAAIINDPQMFTFSVRYRGESEYLIVSTETSAIRPGEVNKIGILANGSHFTFFINDQFVGEAEDDKLAAGRVGFYVLTRPDEVQNVFEFDNLKLSTISSDQLIFLALPDLPLAYKDKPYTYSFCKPDLKLKSDLCGAFDDTTDPIRGDPPYTFQLDTMGGFPPFGINLNLNGILNGTPTAVGEREFTVCAVDQTKAQVCVKKALEVVESKFTLNVKNSGTGDGYITSSNTYIFCNTLNVGYQNCDQEFKEDTEVSLTATPDSGSVFAGWSGDCSGTSSCKVTMDSNKTVNAIFDLRTTSTEAPTTTDGGSEPTDSIAKVTIDSVSCELEEIKYGKKYWRIEASGTATASEGTSLSLSSSRYWAGRYQNSCSSWGAHSYQTCARGSGELETTSWIYKNTEFQFNSCDDGCTDTLNVRLFYVERVVASADEKIICE